jgi:hypothetical protein
MAEILSLCLLVFKYSKDSSAGGVNLTRIKAVRPNCSKELATCSKPLNPGIIRELRWSQVIGER